MDGFCDNSEKGDHLGDLPCTLVGVYDIDRIGGIFLFPGLYIILAKKISSHLYVKIEVLLVYMLILHVSCNLLHQSKV